MAIPDSVRIIRNASNGRPIPCSVPILVGATQANKQPTTGFGVRSANPALLDSSSLQTMSTVDPTARGPPTCPRAVLPEALGRPAICNQPRPLVQREDEALMQPSCLQFGGQQPQLRTPRSTWPQHAIRQLDMGVVVMRQPEVIVRPPSTPSPPFQARHKGDVGNQIRRTRRTHVRSMRRFRRRSHIRPGERGHSIHRTRLGHHSSDTPGLPGLGLKTRGQPGLVPAL